MAPPTAETCAMCSRSVEARLDRNDRAHETIEALVAEVRGAQAANEVKLAEALGEIRTDIQHLAGRRNGRGWWRVPLLATGLAALAGATGWGALALIDHGTRLAVLEKPAAATTAAVKR